jgi:hypothetical protein
MVTLSLTTANPQQSEAASGACEKDLAARLPVYRALTLISR